MYTLVVPSLSTKFIKNSHQNFEMKMKFEMKSFVVSTNKTGFSMRRLVIIIIIIMIIIIIIIIISSSSIYHLAATRVKLLNI